MIFYTLFFIISVGLSKLENKSLLWLWMILCFGFYTKIGWDYYSYFNSYNHNLAFSFLFTRLQNIAEFFGNFQYEILFVGLLFISLFISSIKKYSSCFLLSIAAWLGMDFMSFVLMRQVIAVAIFFYSIRFVLDKKLCKYLLCCILAFGFHHSAIILLPLYWLLNIRLASKYMLCILVLGIFCYFFLDMNQLLFLADYLPNQAARYFNTAYSGHVLNVRVVESLGLFAICWYYRDSIRRKFIYGNIFLNLLFLTCLIYLYFNWIIIYQVRFVKYFEISLIIIVPYLLECVISVSKKRLFIFFACLIIIYFFIRYFVTITGIFSHQNNYQVFVPYQNYLWNMLWAK